MGLARFLPLCLSEGNDSLLIFANESMLEARSDNLCYIGDHDSIIMPSFDLCWRLVLYHWALSNFKTRLLCLVLIYDNDSFGLDKFANPHNSFTQHKFI